MTNFFNFFFQISTNTKHHPAVGIIYFRLLILLVFLSLPFGLQAGELLSESFNAYEMGDDSINWYDSARNNVMGHDEAMFKVFALGGQKVFGTEQTETTNVHSHYVGSGSTNWTNYEYTGLMRISDAKDGIGVTFFSDYPNSDTYYRLRRYNTKSFHIAPHGAGIQCSGKTDTGVVPAPNAWYRFLIQVEDTGRQTDVRAKVWQDGKSEPASWQASCSNTGTTRRVSGTVGLWAVVSGSDEGAKYWDDLKVRSLSSTNGGADNTDDTGANGSSGGGTGGGSADTGGSSGGDGTGNDNSGNDNTGGGSGNTGGSSGDDGSGNVDSGSGGSMGAVTLSWTPPLPNDDETALTDLAGYKIYYGTRQGSYSETVDLKDPGLSSYVIDSLSPNTYYFVMTAYNEFGRESIQSDMVETTLHDDSTGGTGDTGESSGGDGIDNDK